MSASLDDLEPYEIFQQDLDEYLKEYKKEILDSIEEKNQLFIPHTFIEYFCFVNPKSSFDDITNEEITSDFLLYANKKFNQELNSIEIKSSLLNFFTFIDTKHTKLPTDLMKI